MCTSNPDCSAPASPTNGIVTVSADRSVATYSCDSGYILKGVVNRTCRNDSTGWSDSTPTCSKNIFFLKICEANGFGIRETEKTEKWAKYHCERLLTTSACSVHAGSQGPKFSPSLNILHVDSVGCLRK